MHTLTPNLSTPYPARDPITQRPLVADEIWVVDSLCFSHSSALAFTPAAISLEVTVANGHPGNGPYHRIHGVILYAPPVDTPDDKTAAELHWQSSQHPYAVDPERLRFAGRRRGPLAPGVPPA